MNAAEPRLFVILVRNAAAVPENSVSFRMELSIRVKIHTLGSCILK